MKKIRKALSCYYKNEFSYKKTSYTKRPAFLCVSGGILEHTLLIIKDSVLSHYERFVFCFLGELRDHAVT